MKDEAMMGRAALVLLGVILLLKTLFFVGTKGNTEFPVIAFVIFGLPAVFMMVSGMYLTHLFRKITIVVMVIYLLMNIFALFKVKKFPAGVLINIVFFAAPIYVLTRPSYKFYCV